MLILKNAASLNLRLLGAVTTPLEFYTTYYDGPGSSFGDSSGSSSGTSSVEMIAPTIGQYREVKFLSIGNKNTLQQATLYLEIVKPADTKQILYCTLDGLDTLLYSNTEGFKVIDKFGKLKVTVATGGGGGGSGTVTAVSVVPANGFSATIPDPTGNVQITLMAGDITPYSVSATGLITTSGHITTTGSGNITSAGSILAAGSISAANLSGTNTGDQVNIPGNAATVTTNANLTGPVTSSGNATSITNYVITNAKLAQVSAISFKGRNTAVTGDIMDLTPTEATAMLNAFTSVEKGLVPPSGGGTSNFLRADGAWVTPVGGGSSVTNGTALAAARGFAMP